MTQLVLSAAARADVFEIVGYLNDSASPRVAERYANLFERTFALIALHPGIGAPRAAFGSATRLVTAEPCVILYDGAPGAGRVEVLRILHGRRNITPALVAEGRRQDDSSQ